MDEKGHQYIYHTSCARRSYNPNDIKNKYCAVCHTFPEDSARRKALNESIQLANSNY